MFFTDAERGIYTTPDGRRFDPLRILHTITVMTGGRLTELITLRNPETQYSGDVSKNGRVQAMVESARAEMELADVTRKVFGLPSWNESELGDAEVLETLYHFLDYLEGKGSQAPTPRPSEAVSPVVSYPEPTTSS